MSGLADLPDHVRVKLQGSGAVDYTRKGPPATRKAHMIHCPGCDKPVMRGLLSMPAAFSVDADPAALPPESEVLALLDGRLTYNLTWHYDRLELDMRSDWDF